MPPQGKDRLALSPGTQHPQFLVPPLWSSQAFGIAHYVNSFVQPKTRSKSLFTFSLRVFAIPQMWRFGDIWNASFVSGVGVPELNKMNPVEG